MCACVKKMASILSERDLSGLASASRDREQSRAPLGSHRLALSLVGYRKAGAHNDD